MVGGGGIPVKTSPRNLSDRDLGPGDSVGRGPTPEPGGCGCGGLDPKRDWRSAGKGRKHFRLKLFPKPAVGSCVRLCSMTLAVGVFKGRRGGSHPSHFSSEGFSPAACYQPSLLEQGGWKRVGQKRPEERTLEGMPPRGSGATGSRPANGVLQRRDSTPDTVPASAPRVKGSTSTLSTAACWALGWE